jgi:hypothetical protein
MYVNALKSTNGWSKLLYPFGFDRRLEFPSDQPRTILTVLFTELSELFGTYRQ